VWSHPTIQAVTDTSSVRIDSMRACDLISAVIAKIQPSVPNFGRFLCRITRLREFGGPTKVVVLRFSDCSG